MITLLFNLLLVLCSGVFAYAQEASYVPQTDNIPTFVEQNQTSTIDSQLIEAEELFHHAFTSQSQYKFLIQEALDKVTILIEKDLSNTRALFLRFSIYQSMQQPDNALVDLQKFNQFTPYGESLFAECLLLEQLKYTKELPNCYQRTASFFEHKLTDPNKNFDYLLVRLLINRNDLKSAKHLEALIQQTEDAFQLEGYKLWLSKYFDKDFYSKFFVGKKSTLFPQKNS